MKKRGKLIISKEVKNRIDTLHKYIDKEWCGFIMYKAVQGSISDPENYIAKIVDIYPMDLGSHAYTKSDNEAEEIVKMDERCPEYFMSRTGLIHTHHNMKIYFSETDVDELHENAVHYSDNGSYYLSLIVGYTLDYKAKIVKLIDVADTEIPFDEEGVGESVVKITGGKKLLMMDLDIEIESAEDDEGMITRIKELREANVAKTKSLSKIVNGRPNWENYHTSLDPFGQGAFFDDDDMMSFDPNDDQTWIPSFQRGQEILAPNESNAVTFLKLWIGGEVGVSQNLLEIFKDINDYDPNTYDAFLNHIFGDCALCACDVFGVNGVNKGLEIANQILDNHAKGEYEGQVKDIIGVLKENMISAKETYS